LGRRRHVWAPALLAHYGYSPRAAEYFCQVTTNGLAAGIGFREAARRAVFEMVERDAFMLTWLARLKPGRVLEDDSLDPRVLAMLDGIRRQGAEVELYLLDAGLELPVVACLSLGDGRRWPGAAIGLGCDADVVIAATRAILEVGHTAPSVVRSGNAEEGAARSCDVVSPRDHAAYYRAPRRARVFGFMRAPAACAIPLSDLSRSRHFSMRAWAGRAAAAGVRVALVDVTDPALAPTGFNVVRALGTYAQPLDFGIANRRLDNPRLRALLRGRRPNPDPHPLS
jgi:ribosomal protein S12 methylthiotransferase accessory factor